jgi:hypothetical protein
VNKEVLYHYLIDQGRKPDEIDHRLELLLDGDMGELDIWYTENGIREFFTINHLDSIENFVEYVFEFGRTYDR